MININKLENRITLKIKTGCYREVSTPETMKLLGTTKNKITKDKNGENLSHLEIAEVVLVHCNIVNNDIINRIQESCIHLFLLNRLLNY